MKLRLHGVDIGERISQANRAARNWGGDVEIRNAESRTAALIGTYPTGESGGKFRAGSVILHSGGIGFGIGQDFARSVDYGGTGSGGLRPLGGDFGERVRVIGFDAVGQEQRFL